MILQTLYQKLRIQMLVRNGLRLGKNVFIDSSVILDASFCWLISIDDECSITARSIIMAHDASTKRHLGYTKIARVSIGRKTFIGAGTIILPGVNIGENVVIGAGSVVTHDIPDNSVAFGNPARVVQSVTQYIEKHSASMKRRPVYPSRGWTLGNGITDKNRRTMQEALADGPGYVK